MKWKPAFRAPPFPAPAGNPGERSPEPRER